MIERTQNEEELERRVAQAELKFERRFRHLQEACETRLQSLEAEVMSAHAKIEFLRDDVAVAMIETYDSLNAADLELRQLANTLVFNMEEMEDRLGPTFDKAFPDHGRYAQALLDIIDKKPPGER